MGTSIKTISNDTDGYLEELSTQIQDFLSGNESDISNQLVLADMLIAMGERLYDDIELYSDFCVDRKYSVKKYGKKSKLKGVTDDRI